MLVLSPPTHLAKAISSSGPVHGGKFISEGKVPETSATGRCVVKGGRSS